MCMVLAHAHVAGREPYDLYDLCDLVHVYRVGYVLSIYSDPAQHPITAAIGSTVDDLDHILIRRTCVKEFHNRRVA